MSISLSTDEPLAHLDELGRTHLLIEHLQEVAALARTFAARFDAGDWGYLAGLWHDLGKYSSSFQKRIKEAHGIAAHLEEGAEASRDHSTAGAIHAASKLGGADKLGVLGRYIGAAIAGHHSGLPDWAGFMDRLASQEKLNLYDESVRRGGHQILDVPLPKKPQYQVPPKQQKRFLDIWTRMVFSALCDADFLDTERFFNLGRASLRGSSCGISELKQVLDAYMTQLEATAPQPPSVVNQVRSEIRKACVNRAQARTAAFSLTVPTGGGKTLAGLQFALHHAHAHGLERVIVAIPFTSIIEQTAEVYRTVFKSLGNDVVLEHHSAVDPQRETARSRIACENWDAPLVVTTTVQLFESLLGNRPGACRKLHRLVRSVIILDEAQTLPPSLLAPLLDVLRQMKEHFGASIVFSTATQPAFLSSRLPQLDKENIGFEKIEEIVPASIDAFARLRRVQAYWPSSLQPLPYEQLAEEVAQLDDVLVIVHRRDDARKLCERLDALLEDQSTLHLSALMCPAHRSIVLAEIKRRKGANQPVRLVATQLVEAGVDLDFAVVYRALGGMDALAQAAGRCNREGKLSGLGQLRIFVAESDPPRGVPQHALQVASGMYKENLKDLDDPALFQTYFRRLYEGTDPDAKEIQKARGDGNFKTVADAAKLIEDDWSAPLVVPYGDAPTVVAELERYGSSRAIFRKLQRYTVTISKKAREEWLKSGLIAPSIDPAGSVVVLGKSTAAYDQRFGLVPDRIGLVLPETLIG